MPDKRLRDNKNLLLLSHRGVVHNIFLRACGDSSWFLIRYARKIGAIYSFVQGPYNVVMVY